MLPRKYFEDTVPPALTTGMLKSPVTTYFEQANGGEWWKCQNNIICSQAVGSLDANYLEWLWVNVLTDRAGAMLVGGVCTLPTLPTTKWADQYLKQLPAMRRWEGGGCRSVSSGPMCAGVVRLPTFRQLWDFPKITSDIRKPQVWSQSKCGTLHWDAKGRWLARTTSVAGFWVAMPILVCIYRVQTKLAQNSSSVILQGWGSWKNLLKDNSAGKKKSNGMEKCEWW